jgi:hypothetical protein
MFVAVPVMLMFCTEGVIGVLENVGICVVFVATSVGALEPEPSQKVTCPDTD